MIPHLTPAPFPPRAEREWETLTSNIQEWVNHTNANLEK